jgi:hypothetical protein
VKVSHREKFVFTIDDIDVSKLHLENNISTEQRKAFRTLIKQALDNYIEDETFPSGIPFGGFPNPVVYIGEHYIRIAQRGFLPM